MRNYKTPPSDSHNTSPWLSKTQAAERAGVSPKTIDRLRRDRKLRAYLLEGTTVIRFKVEELDALFIK